MVNPKDPPLVMYFLKLGPTSQINTTSWGPSFKAGACWFTPESSHNSHLQTKIAKGTTEAFNNLQELMQQFSSVPQFSYIL